MNRTPRHAPGSVLADRYRVVRTLFGGMGEVIVCHDLASPGQPLVALKTFAGGADHPPAALASLHDEADAWLRLGLGGMRLVQELLRVHAIGGQPYLVMPYCQRGSLRDWLARGDHPAPARMRYLTHVLVGLHELEAEGLVHRDLKPENVLISDEDRAVVTDLGLARDLREQQIAFLIGEASPGDQTSIAGTLPYMAPEQLAGRKDMDTRVDLWAFGVLAIEVLTGTRPFAGADAGRLARAILHDPPQGLAEVGAVAPALTGILIRLLAKERDGRFGSFQELARAWDPVIRFPGSPPHRGLFRRDRRIAIDDRWLADVWHSHFFRERHWEILGATGLTQTTYATGPVMALEKARGYWELDQHGRMVDVLLPELGSLDDDASPLRQLFAGTLAAGTVVWTKAPGRHQHENRVELKLRHEGVVEAVRLLLLAYVSMVEDKEADDTTRGDAYRLAHVVRANPDVNPRLTCHAAQLLAAFGELDPAYGLLVNVVRDLPTDSLLWSSLFTVVWRRDGDDAARTVAEQATTHLADGPHEAQNLCAQMWGALKDWDRSLVHARAAVDAKPASLESRFKLVVALWNLGRRSDAASEFEVLARMAPEWPNTQRLAALFKEPPSA